MEFRGRPATGVYRGSSEHVYEEQGLPRQKSSCLLVRRDGLAERPARFSSKPAVLANVMLSSAEEMHK